jgi:cytoskeleton protein RodZ
MANETRDAVADVDTADEAREAVAPAGQPSEIGIAVEHRSRLATAVALAAAVMTVAWFARALQVGEVMAWLWCIVTGAVAVVQLLVVRDSSAPLLLADDQGVRVRHGETWSGLRWQDIDHVDVTSPSSWLHDGRIVVHPRETDEGETLTPEALTVPLSATTKLRFDGLTGDLVADLDALASGRTPVVVVTRLVPAAQPQTVDEDGAETEEVDQTDLTDDLPAEPAPVVHSTVEVVVLGGIEGADGLLLPRQATAEERDEAAIVLGATSLESVSDVHKDHEQEDLDEVGPVGPVRARKADPEPSTEPVVRFDPVAPVRETRGAARSEVVRHTVRAVSNPVPAQRGTSHGPVVVVDVDDLDLEGNRPLPAAEPVIGPLIAAARNRARLSIDTLSERTRIRPHVLECIEADDFAPCGGDFYARGHLRTLARVFGLEPTELISLYDEHYARPVIEARQVFEAELATGIGGGMRATSTGPRWSVLAAAVVALGLVWGVAHFFTDQPQEIVSPAPNIDSAGLTHAQPATDASTTPKSTLAALAVTAVGDSPQVVVRDRDGRILWAGKLAQGRRQQVIGLGPFDVTASNGKAVHVSYLGRSKGTVGPSSAADSKQFG